LLVQQRRTTAGSDGLLNRVGGASLLVVASLMVAVVPWGGWTLLDSGVGVVWFNAMELVLWGALWCAGWGANGAFALVGAHRWTAQVLSSQLPLMFSLICPALAAGSLRVADVEAAQDGLWFVAIMPVWGPLSGPVGRDLQGGVLSESSGVDRLLVAVGRYALLAAGAAVSVPLFLGGGSGPVLPPLVWSALKTVVVLAALVATRRRFALLRPERFAELAFVVVIPLVLLQVLVVAVYVLGRA
jgi:NADH-quinone oxidoreductase subunit H